MLEWRGDSVRIVKGNLTMVEECLEVGRKLPEFFNQQGLLDMK